MTGAGLFGNALLAHGPLDDPALLALPRAPDDALIEPAASDREGAGVRYRDARPPSANPAARSSRPPRTPAGRLRVASAHLSHVGSGERLLQARRAGGERRRHRPGDLNASIEAPELEPFAGWTDAFAAAGISPGDARRRSTDDGWPIDHVLLRDAWRVERCEVAAAAGDASDHYPVVATLRR